MNDIPKIRPEVVAAKLAALRNFEYPEILEQVIKEPRLIELLWFIQWHSFQLGGLKKFVENFLETFSAKLGTPTMVRLGEPKDGKYTPEQCFAVWKEFPYFVQRNFWPDDYFAEYTSSDIDDDGLPAERKARAAICKLNYPHFKTLCRQDALESLPRYLASLCNQVSQGFDENPACQPSALDILVPSTSKWYAKGENWYFSNLIPALLEAMELQATEWSSKLAKTTVTLKVFDALNYAWEEKALVHIEGDSRFGKTESVRAWANMHPGRARLVATPCTNSDSDLYKEVAVALGMEVSLSRNKLKDRVEYVLQNGRLGIIFDEASFLIQQRYSASTPPMRLNWVRTQIVDKGLPLALCATPQTYTHTLAKFVKKTGHNIQQFLGRTMRKVILPNELEEDDLLAVARIHFPELDEDYLALIAAKAMQSESYLMSVEAIAKLSRYIAKRDGHKQVVLADLELAISEILPPTTAASALPPEPLQRPRNQVLKALKKPTKTHLTRQELRPLVAAPRNAEPISETKTAHNRSVQPAIHV